METEEDRKLVETIISAGCVNHYITAKIRVFESIKDTVSYAKRLETAGACAITVHGRTIEQKREKTGMAQSLKKLFNSYYCF